MPMTCPRCDRPVRYLASERGGARLVVDPERARTGDVVVVDVARGVARRIRQEFRAMPAAYTGDLLLDVPDAAPRYRSHAASCGAR